MDAQKAYMGLAPEYEELVRQIRALVELIENNSWEHCQMQNNVTIVFFTYLYDTLKNYQGKDEIKAKRVKDFRTKAQTEGIHLDKWKLKNNESFRNFILENKEILGGYLLEEDLGERKQYKWQHILRNRPEKVTSLP